MRFVYEASSEPLHISIPFLFGELQPLAGLIAVEPYRMPEIGSTLRHARIRLVPLPKCLRMTHAGTLAPISFSHEVCQSSIFSPTQNDLLRTLECVAVVASDVLGLSDQVAPPKSIATDKLTFHERVILLLCTI